MTDRAFFENEFPRALREHGEIIACTSKPASGEWNRVFYAAVTNRATAPTEPGRTWALVILMHTSRVAGEYFNFHYKELHEECGPAEDTCPDRILELLSRTDHQYALDWRGRCRAHNAQVAKARTLTSGQIVRFARPLTFSDDHGEAHRFQYLPQGRRTVWVALQDDDTPRFRCRIPRWQERSFEIVLD
jgi:YD repeat-containing protein